MRFHDDFTPTVEAAADFEAGRTYQQSRRELAEEAGYDRSDDTIGSRIPLTDPAPFARACAAAREMKAEAWRRERGAG